MKLLFSAISLGLLIVVITPNLTLAQLSDPPATSTSTRTATSTATRTPPAPSWNGQISITNKSGVNDIGGVASKVIVWLLAVIAMVAAIVIIYAGILLVFNGGNEARIKQAKTTLTWAIVGLVVAIGAFALVSIIQGVFS